MAHRFFLGAAFFAAFFALPLFAATLFRAVPARFFDAAVLLFRFAAFFAGAFLAAGLARVLFLATAFFFAVFFAGACGWGSDTPLGIVFTADGPCANSSRCTFLMLLGS